MSDLQGEALFLATRRSRTRELMRILRIGQEFVRGFRAFHDLGPAVTIFGSARFPENHRYYAQAQAIGSAVARAGFAVMTGGGPGLMEAANRGAKEANGQSIGVNIVLPHEQSSNPYVDQVVTFYYFFVRKVILVKYSSAFIILPGGYGTIDELSEAMTLIQTGKLYDFPVILMGSDYWKGLLDWFKDTLLREGTIGPESLDLLTLTDDPDEVIRILRDHAQVLGLKLRQNSPPRAGA
ncbi:MAG: TIGR00730 family Rossman fold protein [Methylotenera sp.]|nr:TIGR00730 family Rossman fold protein [Oligoflexia bacterium]